METGIGRRVFVGSVVAGLPLLAASASRGAAQSAAHAHLDGGASDPLLEHIVKELAAAHNGLRRDLKGEYARAFAAQLRTLAVHGRATDLDARVNSALGALIERDGRDAVLYTEINHERMRAELKRYGAQADERLLNATVRLDYAARSAALNSLLTRGVTTRWGITAATLELVAQEMDRRTSTLRRVSRQSGQGGGYDPAYWEAYCESLWSHYSETQFLAAAICATAALPVIGVVVVPLCIAYQLAALMLAMIYAGECLNVR
jgi:hypothetical protein